MIQTQNRAQSSSFTVAFLVVSLLFTVCLSTKSNDFQAINEVNREAFTARTADPHPPFCGWACVYMYPSAKYISYSDCGLRRS